MIAIDTIQIGGRAVPFRLTMMQYTKLLQTVSDEGPIGYADGLTWIEQSPFEHLYIVLSAGLNAAQSGEDTWTPDRIDEIVGNDLDQHERLTLYIVGKLYGAKAVKLMEAMRKKQMEALQELE